MKKEKVAIYARCSTGKQDHSISNQLDLLRDYCLARDLQICYEFVDEGYSGGSDKRPGLQQLLKLTRSRKIDKVIVLKLDRLFRSLKHLVLTIDEFETANIKFISINDNIDMSTAIGRLTTTLIASMAEFELALIRERTIVGLERARKRGVKLGRPSSNLDHLIIELREKGMTYSQIQQELNCSKGVVCRAIKNAPKTQNFKEDFETQKQGLIKLSLATPKSGD